MNAATQQIEKSANKFLAAMGLNAEITRANTSAVWATAYNGKSQVARVLKRGMHAKLQRSKNSIKAYLPFGGIVNINFDLSQPRNERTVEIMIENDAQMRYCGEVTAKMHAAGYPRLKIADVMVWMYGECKFATGNIGRANRYFRKLVGLEMYRACEADSTLPDVIDATLKIKTNTKAYPKAAKKVVKTAAKPIKKTAVVKAKPASKAPAKKAAVKKVPAVDALFH